MHSRVYIPIFTLIFFLISAALVIELKYFSSTENENYTIKAYGSPEYKKSLKKKDIIKRKTHA